MSSASTYRFLSAPIPTAMMPVSSDLACSRFRRGRRRPRSGSGRGCFGDPVEHVPGPQRALDVFEDLAVQFLASEPGAFVPVEDGGPEGVRRGCRGWRRWRPGAPRSAGRLDQLLHPLDRLGGGGGDDLRVAAPIDAARAARCPRLPRPAASGRARRPRRTRAGGHAAGRAPRRRTLGRCSRWARSVSSWTAPTGGVCRVGRWRGCRRRLRPWCRAGRGRWRRSGATRGVCSVTRWVTSEPVRVLPEPRPPESSRTSQSATQGGGRWSARAWFQVQSPSSG